MNITDEELESIRSTMGRLIIQRAEMRDCIKQLVQLCAIGDTDETTEAYGWGEAIKNAKKLIKDAS